MTVMTLSITQALVRIFHDGNPGDPFFPLNEGWAVLNLKERAGLGQIVAGQ